MASTSASSIQNSIKYDVFLSFQGEDTGKTFVDHLYHALHNKGVITYKDDERIEKEEKITDELIRSIEGSRVHIIVFSKNYASSSCCLHELVKIMEFQKRSKPTACPIFYDVEPTEVRNQTGAVGEAFAKHAVDEDTGRRWRDAMKEAADLSGWKLKTGFDGYRHEAKFIKKIVKEMSLRQGYKPKRSKSRDMKKIGDILIFNELRFLSVRNFKFRSLNLRMSLNLVTVCLEDCGDFEVNMPVECPMLKSLDLSGSKLSNLNLGLTPNIEELYLRECHHFEELHMPVECPNLKFLGLGGPKLCSVNLELIPNLEELYLEECNDSLELHMPVEPKLKILELSGTKVSNLWLTPQLEKLKILEELSLSFKEIERLPYTICMLKHLKSLELKSCLLLQQLPQDIDRLECLEGLYLMDCISLQDIPNNVCKMKSLKYLHLPYCILVKRLPEELGCLECLKVLNIEGAGISHLPPSIFQLKGLHIVWSRWRLESYGFTSLNEISRYTASCLV